MVIRGSAQRNLDDRSVIFKSFRTFGQDAPRVNNIQGKLVISTLAKNGAGFDSISMDMNNLYVAVSSISKTNPPVDPSATYTVTASTFDNTSKDTKTGSFMVKNIDHSIKIDLKPAPKIDEGVVYLNGVMTITGHVA